jgi:hypothetical protein
MKIGSLFEPPGVEAGRRWAVSDAAVEVLLNLF